MLAKFTAAGEAKFGTQPDAATIGNLCPAVEFWTQEQARAHLLGRQGLITRFATELEAVDRMVAVQTQYAQSLSIAVAARCQNPTPGWDDAALVPGGTIVKAWSLRNTLHAHTVSNHAMILGAVGERYSVIYHNWMQRRLGLDARKTHDEIAELLASGPKTRAEIHEAIPQFKGLPMVGWGIDVMGLAYERRLCIVGRGAGQRFAGMAPGESTSRIEDVIEAYFSSYGPATFRDLVHWTGLRAGELKAAFENTRDRLTEVYVDGYAMPRYFGGSAVSPSEMPLRLLAKFDPLVLAHKDKTLLIPEQAYKRVFRKAGQVEAVVLDRGTFVGTWRLVRSKATLTISVEPHGKWSKTRIRDAEREAARIAKALGAQRVEVNISRASGIATQAPGTICSLNEL